MQVIWPSPVTSSKEDQGYSAGPAVVVESLGELLFKTKSQHRQPAEAGGREGACLEEQKESRGALRYKDQETGTRGKRVLKKFGCDQACAFPTTPIP